MGTSGSGSRRRLSFRKSFDVKYQDLVKKINRFDDRIGKDILPVITGLALSFNTFGIFAYVTNLERSNEKKNQIESVKFEEDRLELDHQRDIDRKTTEKEKETQYGYQQHPDARHEVLSHRQGPGGCEGPEGGQGGSANGWCGTGGEAGTDQADR